MLLLNAGLPVSPTRIIDAVWGDELPVNGANVVQKHISGLRGLLGQDPSTAAPNQVLRLTEAGYLLQVEPLSLDLQVFEDYASRARASRAAGQPAEAATCCAPACNCGGVRRWPGCQAASSTRSAVGSMSCGSTPWTRPSRSSCNSGATATWCRS